MSLRPQCPQCQRPLRRCLCTCVRAVSHQTELLLLQHPLEQHEAKGTARLLQRCLQNCRIEIGEQFEPDRLQAWIAAPGTWLLYPPSEVSQAVPDAPDQAPRCLIVLDATWRKSRKMLALNPALQTLPRLGLGTLSASRYVIRKGHAPHQLSTLEAVGAALAQIEARPQIAAALNEALTAFVAWHAALRA